MTTHLRGRAVQAGAFLALVIGGIAVVPSVALAKPPGVEITNLSPLEVASGGKVTMRYTVANTNDQEGAKTRADIRVSGMDCSGDCSQLLTIDQGDQKQFTATLTAPTVGEGQNRPVQVQVSVTINDESASDTQTVNVKGAAKPQTVRQISGKVKDQDGKGISGAQVAMKDSAGHQYDTQSNGSGAYTFTSSDTDPIAPGTITVGAGKDGFQARSVEVQGSAGRSVNVPLTLKAVATASPSPSDSPSPSASATSAPADDISEEPVAPAAPIPSAAQTANTAAGQDDEGGSPLFIIIGGLLVAAGIGAIVLVLMRRKNSNGEGDDPDGFGGPAGSPMPSGPGRYGDQTRIAAPVGGGRADATMVAPMSGAPSISDAPTMLHRPVPAVEDEFPDPYGVPIPQQGGYAGGGNWDNQPGGYGTEAAQYGAGAYGANGQYEQEPAEDPYAAYNTAPSGGYGGTAAPATPRRYDEPTGMYRPESTPDDGYGAAPAGYDQQDGYSAGAPQYGSQYAAQPDQTSPYGAPAEQPGGYPAGGYDHHEPVDEQAGYGAWGAPGSGIDSGNAYGAPQSGAGYAGGAAAGGAYGGAQQYGAGYGAEPAGGYADQAGYDQQGAGYGGYEQQQSPAYGEPGYDQRAGYGEQGGNRRGGQPPQRRPPEWDN